MEQRTFTDKQVKDLMLKTLGKMMPKQQNIVDLFNGTRIVEAIEFGEKKAQNMERMVYLRGISDLDETIRKYKEENQIEPIHLLTDDEIERQGRLFLQAGNHSLRWESGAKWMRDKVKTTLK